MQQLAESSVVVKVLLLINSRKSTLTKKIKRREASASDPSLPKLLQASGESWEIKGYHKPGETEINLLSIKFRTGHKSIKQIWIFSEDGAARFQMPGWNQLLSFLWEIYYWKILIKNSHTSDYMNSSVLCVTEQSIKQSIGLCISCIYSIFSLHVAGSPLGLLKYLIKTWLSLASSNTAASHQR